MNQGMKDIPIEIVPYHISWPAEFEEIAAALRHALGELALRIDHIGSTSVPGLDAKDIIDIQLTVANFDPPLDESLRAVGCTLIDDIQADHQPVHFIGPASEWEKRYYQPPAGQRPTHLHVRIQNHANQRYPLLFRDYLRTHPAAAGAYASLKHSLARYHGDDREAYTLLKDPACDIIMAAAEEWAAVNHWKP